MKILATSLSLLTLGIFSLSTVNAQQPPGRPQNKPPSNRVAGVGDRDKRPDRGSREEISKEDREKLRAAMEAVKDDPAVVASREAVKKAIADHRKILREALLSQDPSLAPVLKKLGENFPPRQVGPGVRPGGKGDRDKPDAERGKDAEDFMSAAGE